MSYLAQHAQVQQLVHTHRDAVNQSVRARLASGAKLDATDFLLHLDASISPIVKAILECMPERAGSALLALSDVSLDLLSAGQLSPKASDSVLARVWNEVLPLLASPLALQPKLLAACLCNAAIQISLLSPPAALRWLATLQRVCPSLRDPELVLATGTFLGWTAGLPQYRHSALRRAKAMPPEIVAQCLGVVPNIPSADIIERTLDALQTDPWARPPSNSPSLREEAVSTKKQLLPVGSVGCFRGLGGTWLTPPRVWLQNDRLLASDGLATYQIHADRFGAALTRVRSEDRTAPPPPSHDAINPVAQPASLQSRITASPEVSEGKLVWGTLSVSLGGIERCTSLACDGHTAAWTLPDSFHIFLIAHATENDRIQLPHWNR